MIINFVIYIILFYIFANYMLPYAICKIQKKYFLYEYLKKNKGLFITFDDGPHEKITKLILDRLNKANIKGNFFINLMNVPGNQHIVERIIDDGHLLGIHSYSHLHPWKTNPFSSFYDLYRSDIILEKMFGFKTQYFRPPYGKYNLGTLCYIILFRKKVIFWNSDPKDYRIIDETSFSAFRKKIYTYIDSNCILLLHDKKKENTFTIPILNLIIEEANRANISIKKISY